MCRSGNGDGPTRRRCPCRRDPAYRALETARQRASRYARWCDAAADLDDHAAATKYGKLLDRAVADLEQRGRGHTVCAPVPPPPPSRAAEFTAAATRDWTDDQLEQAVCDCLTAGGDQPALDALERVIDARQAAADLVVAAPAGRRHAQVAWEQITNREAWAEPSALLSPGLRPTSRLSPAQQLRADYETWVDTQWLQAETDCRGQLLTPAARAAGVDPRSLFSGPLPRALKHGSEELQSWWGAHGRLSLAAFRYQAIGRDSDRAAAEYGRRETFDNAAVW